MKCPNCDRSDFIKAGSVTRKIWCVTDKEKMRIEQVECSIQQVKCKNCHKVVRLDKPDNRIVGVHDDVVDYAEKLLLSYSVEEVQERINGAIKESGLYSLKSAWANEHSINGRLNYDGIESFKMAGIYMLRTADNYYYCLCNIDKGCVVDVFKSCELPTVIDILERMSREQKLESIYIDDVPSLNTLDASFVRCETLPKYNRYALVSSISSSLCEEIAKSSISKIKKADYLKKCFDFSVKLDKMFSPNDTARILKLLRMDAMELRLFDQYIDFTEREDFKKYCYNEYLSQIELCPCAQRAYRSIFPEKYRELIIALTAHVNKHPHLDFDQLRNRIILYSKPIIGGTHMHVLFVGISYQMLLSNLEDMEKYYN